MWKHKKILIGLSGSIAAYKVCEIISTLKKQGAEVKTIATPSALQFVGKASLEGLSGQPVLTDDFTDGSMMSHITLAKWADLFLIAPATAQTLNALASGTGHGILTSTYLAYDLKKPLVIAPAMNSQMLAHPTTQESLHRLQEMGVRVLNTDAGELACGDVGLGRLLEPEQIISQMEKILTPGKSLSILITAGGTQVPIDSVRSITNTSSGETGSMLATYFAAHNHKVDLLLSKNGLSPAARVSTERFETYQDLSNLMEQKLRNNSYDLVIHAAAVSDFEVERADGKMPSGKKMQLQLVPTEKILPKIKSWNANCRLVGFKLTDTNNESEQQAAINKVFGQNADLVVHNDLSEISRDSHHFALYDKTQKLEDCFQKTELGPLIEKFALREETL